MPSDFKLELPNYPEFPEGLTVVEICTENGLDPGIQSACHKVRNWLRERIAAGDVVAGRGKRKNISGVYTVVPVYALAESKASPKGAKNGKAR
jgi:hypothetical protein